MCGCAGYEGENCQVDINECELNPCENGGECFERSDVLNYGMLPELSKANFSYEQAAGFMCHCLPGFTGETFYTSTLLHFTHTNRYHHELKMVPFRTVFSK